MAFIQLDHAVFVVDEEPRARDFYMDYFGMTLHHAFTREGRVPGKVMHRSFLTINDRGHGIALFEDRVTVPAPTKDREFACVVFRVAPERFARIKGDLKGIELTLPVPFGGPTFYTHDTEGNPIGVVAGEAGSDTYLLRVEFDVANLAEATTFYEEIFGMKREAIGTLPDSGQSYGWFPSGEGDQGLLLVESASAPSANVGHHFAWLLNRQEHLDLKEGLARHGVEEVPGHEGDRVEGEIGTYVVDPGGRKLQWITHADTP